MTHIITRQKAIEEINNVIPRGECLICWLNSNAKYVLHEGKYVTVVLSQYPRTWGQIMIFLNAHKTLISEITDAEWNELTAQARKAAIIIEKKLNPLRCYMASLGAVDNLPNTCPHVHFNVIPLYNSGDKPADIFTWENGVTAAEEQEWQGLYSDLLSGWK